MEFLLEFFGKLVNQFQSPTLGFLVGGMIIAACGSKLEIPKQVYQFIVFMLLIRIGLKGGMEIRDANLIDMALPMVICVVIGAAAVLIGSAILTRLPGVKKEDGYATAGLFGAVSASTLAAAMVMLEEKDIAFEAWVAALYPFMDIPALILAIVMAKMASTKSGEDSTEEKVTPWSIIKESLQSSAISALLLGMLLGLFTNPEKVFDSFYDPLFRGFLSVLMLIMGIEAYQRLAELRRVAHWFALYAVIAPIAHGLLGFGLGYIAHVLVGFSPGGVILLAVIAASNSDVSGPPTLRAGIPAANPSAYIGASTSVGTPVAIAVCIPLFVALGEAVF